MDGNVPYGNFTTFARIFHLHAGGQHLGGRKARSAWGEPTINCRLLTYCASHNLFVRRQSNMIKKISSQIYLGLCCRFIEEPYGKSQTQCSRINNTVNSDTCRKQQEVNVKSRCRAKNFCLAGSTFEKGIFRQRGQYLRWGHSFLIALLVKKKQKKTGTSTHEIGEGIISTNITQDPPQVGIRPFERKAGAESILLVLRFLHTWNFWLANITNLTTFPTCQLSPHANFSRVPTFPACQRSPRANFSLMPTFLTHQQNKSSSECKEGGLGSKTTQINSNPLDKGMCLCMCVGASTM